MKLDKKIEQRLKAIYGPTCADGTERRIIETVERYGFDISDAPQKRWVWSAEDIVLITYGDVILPEFRDHDKLQALTDFVREQLGDLMNSIHILPFFPSSSDQGFSVIDYKKVRENLGEWDDIRALSKDYHVMADLVINHASRFSTWFENYRAGEDPGSNYFISMDPETNLTAVTRPRSSSLLTQVKTENGLKYMWTTFSDDQVDLNFSNPEVLLEFIDIFLFYLSQGIRIIRLDAVAYLWKKAGTNSIHLSETHQIIKLFRDIIDHIDADVTLITETNVPFEENVSYFGEGDEAHMIYQFSLPPLLLHAILTENATYLADWARNLPEPPKGCTYFNFTASHDGIGVRPLEGLVADEDFDYLIKSTKDRGGFVSYKTNDDGTESPYELNITYFDAFIKREAENNETQIKRYICSQLIMLELQGVPGIYFHNLTATENYQEGIAQTGEKRAINRKQWSRSELDDKLADESTTMHRVFNKYKKILGIRKAHAAFSPEAEQQVLPLSHHFFGIVRKAKQAGEAIVCISNVTSGTKLLNTTNLTECMQANLRPINLLSGEQRPVKSELSLDPYETVWLHFDL